MITLSIKVPIRKKSGNLFNDPHIYIYIYIERERERELKNNVIQKEEFDVKESQCFGSTDPSSGLRRMIYIYIYIYCTKA